MWVEIAHNKSNSVRLAELFGKSALLGAGIILFVAFLSVVFSSVLLLDAASPSQGHFATVGTGTLCATGADADQQSALKEDPLSDFHGYLRPSQLRNQSNQKLRALFLQVWLLFLALAFLKHTTFLILLRISHFFQVLLKTISPVRAGPIQC